MKIGILNAYSTDNAGDGLLVAETIKLVRDAFGEEADLTIMASHPDSFRKLGLAVIDTKPSVRGYSRPYLTLLRNSFQDFDLLVGVGGGYLRAGTCVETVKSALVMYPQLISASRRGGSVVYLPQSIGPVRFGLQRHIERLLAKLQHVFVRDDRSLEQFRGAGVQRSSDLALLGFTRDKIGFDEAALPVISVRSHRGSVPKGAIDLARNVGAFDGYVQSTVGSNNDTEPMNSIGPKRVLNRDELMFAPRRTARVVVAVRLHAALMAIAAGHFVIHLAYERKGFGAFEDLGLSEYVHNVHSFNPATVMTQMSALRRSDARAAYDDSLLAASAEREARRQQLIDALHSLGTDRATSR